MKEHMENLIKLLQERKTVERLIEAEDKFELFVNEKKELENELENLKKYLVKIIHVDVKNWRFYHLMYWKYAWSVFWLI